MPNFFARTDAEKFSSTNSAFSANEWTTAFASKLAGSERFHV